MNAIDCGSPDAEHIGQLVSGRVVAVFQFGVVLDVSLSRLGFIDVVYIDDSDTYSVGDVVDVYLDTIDERKGYFIARPPHQKSVADRLREKGFDV